MKKYLMLAAVSALVFSATDSLADSKSQTATVTAKVVGAGAVEADQNMNFGTIVSSTEAQVAKITPGGQLSGVVTADGEDVKAAQFTVKGDTGMAYKLQATSDGLTSGSNTMELKNFVLLVDDSAYLESENTISGGSDTVKVGADLMVGANQASGTYTGNITLTMSY